MTDSRTLAVGRQDIRAEPENGRPESTRYRYVVAISLCVVYTFNFLDRKFLAILAEPVKRSLHLSDTQLGLLTGLMFALFYTIFGIPVAALADRYNRVRIVALACGLLESLLSRVWTRCVEYNRVRLRPPVDWRRHLPLPPTGVKYAMRPTSAPPAYNRSRRPPTSTPTIPHAWTRIVCT